VADAISSAETKVAAVLGAEGPRGGDSAARATLTAVSAATGALYAELGRADATPTLAQHNATTETEKRFSEAMKQWATWKQTDLPALNQQLRRANLSEIRLDDTLPQDDDSEDIE
jgi:hypothetical protein